MKHPKKSEAKHKAWQNPEFRAKMLKIQKAYGLRNYPKPILVEN